ncbi:MAG: gamma-glutamyltransferase [Burkholderiales bacterium]|tara:strand:- start:20703 stop:22466 length:1764 start_codon:yes stop_codon:yes gene_type:complete
MADRKDGVFGRRVFMPQFLEHSLRWIFSARSILKLSTVYFFVIIFCSLSHQTQASDSCAIATAHPEATAAGCEVLLDGGNAFDAAIAVTAALGVVEPYSSGLGGGGFYLLHVADSGRDVFVDAREIAPERASEGLYLNAEGLGVPLRSREGPLAAAIPGIPAALQHLSTVYAKLPLEAVLQPAITLARDGFSVDPRYVRAVGWVEKRIRKFKLSERIFFNKGEPFKLGEVLKQPDLAQTLETMAKDIDSFYRGSIAHEMVNHVVSSGGNWTLDDLKNYQVKERAPVIINFNGAKIVTAPLPSSGGLVMAQVFNILEDLSYYSHDHTVRPHLMVEAMRRGYNDRARFMGDPDFSDAPLKQLMSLEYARKRGRSISFDAATDSDSLPTVFDLTLDGEETTHFSIVDDEGNRVAATLSINGPFGSGMVAGNTGILLNNHMDDFSIGIGKGNAYELVGNRANGIEPRKRPLSSMSPTFVGSEKGDLAIGTPGGSRIISMVMLAILEYLDPINVDPEAIVSLARYHHQYLPDRVQVEPDSFDDAWISQLRSKGHDVQVYRRKWGNMQAIHCDTKQIRCSVLNDPRGRAGVVF